MEGPYALTMQHIDWYAIHTSGAYLLTYGTEYYVCYVGRSDDDVNARLKDHLPENETDLCISGYDPSHFYVMLTSSAKAAYDEECRRYHEFTPKCNKVHPQKTYSSWSCPVCGA